ncbi:GNAT family N-acetyltransferase [Planococcus halotolerans]|uniref:GNAT family N-acetyltransferase n=1 Tax=Planococcus halotolerans TaxID=2233542 RepID=UPI0010925922|nr:GNAT family protein [Planococcus halotolerans]QHJ69845.1 GNAT family N-acetyltransferase [Planococcus halotolerans]
MNETPIIYSQLPTIESERLILRKLELADAEDMFEYASEPLVSRFMPWQAHQTTDDTREFIGIIRKGYEDNKKLTWAIELKGEKKMIGTIDFVSWLQKRQRSEVGYTLSHHYWGQGLMLEAAETLIDFGFRKMDLIKVEAPIMLDNKQSQRVAEKLGMIREGVLRKHMIIKGEFVDLAMYAVLKEEFYSR